MTGSKIQKALLRHAALLCMVVVLLAGSDKSIIKKWDPASKLTWKDYRDTTDKKLIASTCTGMHWSARRHGVDSVIVRVYSYMDRDRSWVSLVNGTEAALNHEQYHFNIREYWCRKLKKDLASTTLEPGKYKGAVSTMVNDNSAACQGMETEYETATKEGSLKAEQKKWEQQVDDLLTGLDAYAGGSVVVGLK